MHCHKVFTLISFLCDKGELIHITVTSSTVYLNNLFSLGKRDGSDVATSSFTKFVAIGGCVIKMTIHNLDGVNLVTIGYLYFSNHYNWWDKYICFIIHFNTSCTAKERTFLQVFHTTHPNVIQKVITSSNNMTLK